MKKTIIEQIFDDFAKSVNSNIATRSLVKSAWAVAQKNFPQPCLVICPNVDSYNQFDLDTLDFTEVQQRMIHPQSHDKFRVIYDDCKNKQSMPLFIASQDVTDLDALLKKGKVVPYSYKLYGIQI